MRSWIDQKIKNRDKYKGAIYLCVAIVHNNSELMNRDYIEGEARSGDQDTRTALMCAWTREDMSHVDTFQPEPEIKFWQSARQAETLPNPEGEKVVTFPSL